MGVSNRLRSTVEAGLLQQLAKMAGMVNFLDVRSSSRRSASNIFECRLADECFRLRENNFVV